MVSENPGGPTDSHEEKCPEANRKCRTTGPSNHRPAAPRSCILAATAQKRNTSLHACAAGEDVLVWGCSSPLLTSAGQTWSHGECQPRDHVGNVSSRAGGSCCLLLEKAVELPGSLQASSDPSAFSAWLPHQSDPKHGDLCPLSLHLNSGCEAVKMKAN